MITRLEVGEKEVIANTCTLCTLLLIVGLVSACGSGSDTTASINTQETVDANLLSNDDTAIGSTEETSVEPDRVKPENGETGNSAAQDTNQNSGDGSPETTLADPQNDSEQASTGSQQEPTNSGADAIDGVQPVADNQRVNFGTAKLLVDLVPDRDSYPAKFHREGDQLYFWTVDTDPRFASCAYHWGDLNDDDKKIALNLVAIHRETGVVAMNKKIMTVGDFAENANSACAGYNGTIMQVFEQTWITPRSATGEQQFALQFDSFSLGPDQVWKTDGSESNTSQLEAGVITEQSFFEGDKVFFVGADGLSVSDSLAGDRRRLFETDDEYYYGDIKQIVKSPARQATFEIKVGQNRFQIWTYDLDTDEWVKQFSIKPDANTYVHHETLLVNGQVLLSLGQDLIENESAMGFSSNYGDVTSFEILTDAAPTISNTDTAGTHTSSNEETSDRLVYSTTDYSVEPHITSISSYRQERIEKLFSMSEPGLNNMKVLAGYNGRIYVAGTKVIRQWPETTASLELWSYDPQTGQLVKLSKDDWYAVKHNHATPDEGYIFRYLNSPDGLIFVNLKEDSGRELWFTDGTPDSTRQLADINPGAGNSDPQNFHYSGDAIYFSANDGTHGHEPWMIQISR